MHFNFFGNFSEGNARVHVHRACNGVGVFVCGLHTHVCMYMCVCVCVCVLSLL